MIEGRLEVTNRECDPTFAGVVNRSDSEEIRCGDYRTPIFTLE